MKKILYILFIFYFFYINFSNNFNYISNEKFINEINNNTEFYKIKDDICYYDNKNSNFFISNYNCSPNIRLNFTIIDTFYNNVIKFQEGNNILNSLLYLLLPFLILIIFLKKSLSSKLVNNLNDIVVKKDIDKNITIDNFIGCNNIKKDINEVILQIKNNNLFLENNCNLPKGILLLGPPGCGKTHLVKTIINSTGINYIFTSGSDINKIFVGSGSMMIDNIFNNARSNKPCVIFIDEADTIIKARQHVEVSSTTTEFGSTLCKLLAELDSLKTENDIIVILATNMNEQYIDKALLRSGRVDKIIYINEPIYDERKDLFKMYLEKLINDNIDLDKIAKISYGLTGADVKKIINSIKIKKINKFLIDNKIEEEINTNKINEIKDINLKLRIKEFLKKIFYREKEKIVELKDDEKKKCLIDITTKDISEEIDRCILGLEREKKINNKNRELIAFHETGHAIMSFLLKDTILPTKVCISITSKTLGYTMYHNDEEDIILNSSLNNLLRQIMILYSGRCAEKKFMNEVTCGAEDDYSKARKLLKRILMNGMLLSELNYVEIDNLDKIKVPDFIEKIINILNKILINRINILLEKNKILIYKIADVIILNGYITDDEIKQIFIENNMVNRISSIDIKNVLNEIIYNIKKNDKIDKKKKIKSK